MTLSIFPCRQFHSDNGWRVSRVLSAVPVLIGVTLLFAEFAIATPIVTTFSSFDRTVRRRSGTTQGFTNEFYVAKSSSNSSRWFSSVDFSITGLSPANGAITSLVLNTVGWDGDTAGRVRLIYNSGSWVNSAAGSWIASNPHLSLIDNSNNSDWRNGATAGQLAQTPDLNFSSAVNMTSWANVIWNNDGNLATVDVDQGFGFYSTVGDVGATGTGWTLVVTQAGASNAAPVITAAELNNGSGFVNGNISVPEGTASLTARATVSDADNNNVAVTIDGLSPVTVVGGNGTTSSQTLNSPANVDLRDEGSVNVTFNATDGTDPATQVTRSITVTNVAPTLDILQASYNPTFTLIDDNVVITPDFDIVAGTTVTFTFDIDDPGILDALTASFEVDSSSPGLEGFAAGSGGNLAGSFMHTFTNSGEFSMTVQLSDGDGGNVQFLNFGNLTVEAVPEPSSVALGLCGLAGLLGIAIAARRAKR